MNYYFLLEDEKSFLKVLPKWLNHMDFRCERVADIKSVQNSNYVLQSGQGVTQLITKVLFDTIDTIICNPGTIDKLVVILDAENECAEDRRRQVYSKIEEKYELHQLAVEIKVLVCNRCFETWLLGCEGVYPQEEVDSKSFFYPFYCYYDVSQNDPEGMSVPQECGDTVGRYHFHYLHEMLRYRKMRYSKNRPDVVAECTYFTGLMKRIHSTDHIKSFKEFVEFVENEKQINACGKG